MVSSRTPKRTTGVATAWRLEGITPAVMRGDRGSKRRKISSSDSAAIIQPAAIATHQARQKAGRRSGARCQRTAIHTLTAQAGTRHQNSSIGSHGIRSTTTSTVAAAPTELAAVIQTNGGRRLAAAAVE